VAHILVVESNLEQREALTRGLRGDGHHVHLAASLSEARALLEPSEGFETFDAALVNEQQSDGDGVTFMAELRANTPRCARVLVGDQTVLSAMVRAVNIGGPHQVVNQKASIEAKCQAVDSALLVVRSAVNAARTTPDGPGREYLHRLLEGPEFMLAVQPIRFQEGEIFGYEGLIRTSDPSMGGPLHILHLAERYDLLDHLLYAVARRARGLLEDLPVSRSLFLNLHPADLADPEELVRLLRPIHDHAERVALEITGRVHTRWSDTLRERLEPLRMAGFTVGIDDMGTGEGALMLLAESSPGFIKAHESMIRGIGDSPRKLRILEMLCRFAQGTRARVIAEGVEREDEAKALQSLGIPLYQGFLFGAPSLDPTVFGAEPSQAKHQSQ